MDTDTRLCIFSYNKYKKIHGNHYNILHGYSHINNHLLYIKYR